MKTIQEIKQLSIVDYLQQAGHEPKQIKGNAYWYSSPLRQERTPSFKVNTERNQWYDFATGEQPCLCLATLLNSRGTATPPRRDRTTQD